MAINNFKSFASTSGANVTSQEDYEALSALLTGFQAGKASSAQINKALRQSSSMAAMLGQFLNAAGLDAIDNGSIATLLSSFTTALTTNLSLGTASKKNVGVTTGNIPDMSSFGSALAFPGWQKLPSGLIMQWGASNAGSTSRAITFPIPFPAGIITVNHYDGGWNTSSNGSKWGVSNKTLTGFTAITDTAAEGGHYFALGF